MANNVQRIQQQEPIVDPDTGKPTDYLMRTLGDQGTLLTSASDTLDQVMALEIIAGTGLDGGGTIQDAIDGPGTITLDANVQDILDQISTTQGSILYRNASDWVALAPGTSGYALKTQGAAANPVWGSVVASVDASGGTTGFTFTGGPITTSGTLTLSVSNAATVRSSIGLVIGTDVQAYDGDLAAIAALTGTNTIYYRSGTSTWTAVTIGSGLSFSSGTLKVTDYSFGFFFTSTPTASEVLALHVAGAAFTIPANFSGGLQSSIGTNPTASFALDVQKNGSTIGTITVSTGGAVSATTTSGTSKSIAAGDVLKVVAPGSADATAANMAFTLIGAR